MCFITFFRETLRILLQHNIFEKKIFSTIFNFIDFILHCLSFHIVNYKVWLIVLIYKHHYNITIRIMFQKYVFRNTYRKNDCLVFNDKI